MSTVLIVEDEKPLRDVYSIVLEKAGYDVLSATNGREGLEQAEKNCPDFVLLDIFMPVLDGVGFMRTLNKQKCPDMKVVVFSNNSDSGIRDEVCRLGAKEVVLKSDLSPNGLVDLVKAQLAEPSESPRS